MKHHYSDQPSSDARRVSRRVFPLLSHNFQPTSMQRRGGSVATPQAVAEARTLRKLSSDFLGAETRRSYALEAAAFAFITVVSAWPIVVMFRTLWHAFG